MNGTQFTPLENFGDAELKSEYLVGLSYTVRDYRDASGKIVKAEESLLAKKLPSWIAEGKVRLGAPTPEATQALVTGGEASASGVVGEGTVS